MIKKIANDFYYIGVNDHVTDLFEGQYSVPNGMSYNSYVVLDNKITVFDSVDRKFSNEWLENLKQLLIDKNPDYLIISHMEPDHSASIEAFLKTYPDTILVGNLKTFSMLDHFYGNLGSEKRLIVSDSDTLSTGKHTFSFYFAPMVHWPEVMVTFDHFNNVLFSADAFGKFGALDVNDDWVEEARRYYIGIVGKYGVQVQNLFKKISNLSIETICPLHGPILKENLSRYLQLYNTWSTYGVEQEGILIAYTSIYGNTKNAVEALVLRLKDLGCPRIVVRDLARSDMSQVVAEAFSYGKVVLATTTYNADLFPHMSEFIHHLVQRNFSNRTIALIENGSWGPMSNKIIKKALELCKNINIIEPSVTLHSAMDDNSRKVLNQMAEELCKEYNK